MWLYVFSLYSLSKEYPSLIWSRIWKVLCCTLPFAVMVLDISFFFSFCSCSSQPQLTLVQSMDSFSAPLIGHSCFHWGSHLLKKVCWDIFSWTVEHHMVNVGLSGHLWFLLCEFFFLLYWKEKRLDLLTHILLTLRETEGVSNAPHAKKKLDLPCTIPCILYKLWFLKGSSVPFGVVK